MKIRLSAILLVLCFALTLLPATALAADSPAVIADYDALAEKFPPSGDTLSISSDITVTGLVGTFLANKTLIVEDGVTVTIDDGGFIMGSVNISGKGVVVVKSGGSFASTMGGAVNNNGSVTVEEGGTLICWMGGNIFNNEGASLVMKGDMLIGGYFDDAEHLWFINSKKAKFECSGNIFVTYDASEEKLEELKSLAKVDRIYKGAPVYTASELSHALKALTENSGVEDEVYGRIDIICVMNDMTLKGDFTGAQARIYVPEGVKLTLEKSLPSTVELILEGDEASDGEEDPNAVKSVAVDFKLPKTGYRVLSDISIAVVPEKTQEELVLIVQWSIVGEDGSMTDLTEEELKTARFEAGKTYHLHLGLVLMNDSEVFDCEPRDVLLNGEAAGSDATVWFPEKNVVCVDIEFGPLEAAEPSGNPFTDVAEGSYYYDAVLWAVENGITSGTSATTFSPSDTCTRAQVVTFLWRASGSPEPSGKSNPFSDVKADAYYLKAVLWAVEKGVTVGTSDTTFSPDETCTSAQIITFLWRANGKPAASGDSSLARKNSGKYFTDAVAWADCAGILSGGDPVPFSADAPSPRADIVTYLWRNSGE